MQPEVVGLQGNASEFSRDSTVYVGGKESLRELCQLTLSYCGFANRRPDPAATLIILFFPR